MALRKYLYTLVAAATLGLTACDDYDDGALWDAVNDHESRLEALEKWQEQVNGNIAALQQLLSTTDYITKVTPIREDGRQVGYTIEFLNQPPITIYNGDKGDTGAPGQDGDDGQDGADGTDGRRQGRADTRNRHPEGRGRQLVLDCERRADARR